MLYDPRWDQNTLLDRWIAWLETKDPDERYRWVSWRNCACGQFYGGEGWVKYGAGGWSVLNGIARGLPWTFGGCLERAKAYRDSK